MQKILITGAGKIGSLIACLLSQTKDYEITLADVAMAEFNGEALGNQKENISLITLDVRDNNKLTQIIEQKNITSIISCLPFYVNESVAEIALSHRLNYFDLTEDITVTETVKKLSEGASTAFVPQCGLAPGFISIVANDLMKKFDTLESVSMRVGALPVHPNNALKYSLTWSTDGLINEYGNLCSGIVNGKETPLLPLEGLETIEIDGLLYEAFNTSGGLGSLSESYRGKVVTMNYKTLRYPGHCEKIKLLMNDLKLNQHRDSLKEILERAIPKTLQDVVIVYVAVSGKRQNELYEENYVKKIYPQHIAGRHWSAIQVTTASGLCAVVDNVLLSKKTYHGLVLQEDFTLSEIIHNRFGQYYL